MDTAEVRAMVTKAIDNGKITFRKEHDSDGDFVGCYFGEYRFDWYLSAILEIIEEEIEEVIDDIMNKLWYLTKEEFDKLMEIIKEA